MIQWKCVVMSSCLTRFALLTTVDTLPTMTEPKEKASHEVNRLKVCAPCGKKLNKKDARKISLEQIQIMQTKYENFTIENCAFPYGICNTCRIHVGKFQQGKTKILPEMPYYSDMILPRPTRADQDPNCFCYKCLTGSDTRPQNSVKTMPKIIKLGSGLLGSSTENSLPKVPRAEKRIYDQVCQICRQEIGKGLVQ